MRGPSIANISSHDFSTIPLPNRNPDVVLKWKVFNYKPHFMYYILRIFLIIFLYNIDVKYY